MAKDGAVKVTGDKEAADALAQLEHGLEPALEQASATVAQTVKERAHANALGLGGVAGKAAPALSVEDGEEAAAVALDGDQYPFALGAEFGAIRYKQFDTWRGAEDGYFLYPAIRETEETNADAFEAAVDDLISSAGLDE